MAEWITDFMSWMETLSPWLICGVILLIAYGENVLPPIPGDLVVVYGGYLAGIGRVDLVLVVALATVGGAVGFMTMFAVGRKLGRAVLDEERLRWLPKKQLRKAEEWMQRWGYGLIAANRFLSGTRSVIALVAGMARMTPGRVAVYATLSALVWTALIGYLGYALGDNWPLVGKYLQRYGNIILGMGLVLVLILIVRAWRRRRLGSETVKK